MNDPDTLFGHLPRPRLRPVRWAVAAGIILLLVLIGGFVHFAATLPSPPAAKPQADAIVVLTGGRDRIAAALELLEGGHGARLLISGVNRDVTRAALEAGFADRSTRFACCVDLGFEARSTLGNAAEAAAWARAHGYTSLIVVTSSYHMPRSLLVLRRQMPDIELKPWPVRHSDPDGWRALALARILVPEYAKYLVTLVRAPRPGDRIPARPAPDHATPR